MMDRPVRCHTVSSEVYPTSVYLEVEERIPVQGSAFTRVPEKIKEAWES